MKKFLSVFSIIFLTIFMTSCVTDLNGEKFSARLIDGNYLSTNEFTTNNKDITTFQTDIKVSEASIMEYVKKDGRNMVKDLFTVEERFYTTFRVEIKITINEEEHIVQFEKMKANDNKTTTEYVIEKLTTDIEGLSKICFTILDKDLDEYAEAASCELVFVDDTKNIKCELLNNTVLYRFVLKDPENLCTEISNGGVLMNIDYTYKFLPETYLLLSIKTSDSQITQNLYLELSNGEQIFGEYNPELSYEHMYFSMHMPNEDLVVTIRKK